MTPKAIIERVINFSNPPRIGFDLSGGPSDFLGIGVKRLGEYPEKPGKDEWGCIWEKKHPEKGSADLGYVVYHPLADYNKISEYVWPNPDDPNRYLHFAERLSDPLCEERYIASFFEHGLFERLWMLRGYEQSLIDMYTSPAIVHEIIEHIADIHMRVIRNVRQYSNSKVQLYMIWDDLGTQRGSVFSIDFFRKFFKESYSKLISVAHNLGMKVWLHSDGKIIDVIEELIDVKLDVIEVTSPLLLGLEEMAKRLRGKIVLQCCPDSQLVTPYASREEVRKHVYELIKDLALPTGGFIADIYPLEEHKLLNVPQEIHNAAIEAFQEFATLPRRMR